MGKKKAAQKAAEALVEADGAVAEVAEPLSDTPVVKAIGTLSELGDQPQMRMLCLAVIGLGLVNRSPRLTRTGVQMIAAHQLATSAKNFIKKRVDRTRPRADGNHAPSLGKHTHKEITSFPSGHSAGAAAVACAYARQFPEHKAAAYAGAGAIAIAQIPRCAHYLTDVAAGLALGVAAEAVVDWAVEALQLSGEEPAE